MDELPIHSVTLIEELDKMFPPKCIREGEALESAHRYAAKREMVEWLLVLKRRAEKGDERVR